MANINLTDSSNIEVVQNGGNISLDLTTTGVIGDLSNLNTTDKDSLVDAINEIQAYVDDTGWNALSLNTGISNASGYQTSQIRRIGKHVFIRGVVSFTMGSSAVQICSIPTGYIPTNTAYSMTATGGTRVARINANSGGVLYVEWIYNLNNTSAYTGTVNWLDITLDYWLD